MSGQKPWNESLIQIRNYSGLANDTEFILPNGDKLSGVRRLEIPEFGRDDVVEAKITVLAKMDIAAVVTQIENAEKEMNDE